MADEQIWHEKCHVSQQGMEKPLAFPFWKKKKKKSHISDKRALSGYSAVTQLVTAASFGHDTDVQEKKKKR